MNLAPKGIILVFVLVTAVVVSVSIPAGAINLPIEPEDENVEYLLDLWTNQFDRYWRESWEGGYNRFLFRLGSNNVRDWFIEEQLKFASPLLGRLRFRFYHTRLIHDSSDQRGHDIVEFEGRVFGDNYFSVFLKPLFEKAENSLGLMLQNRQAADRYACVFVEFPHLVRNFAVRHGNTEGKILTVFTDRPIRYGLDIREPLDENVWLRLTGELIPGFTTGREDGTTGDVFDRERGQAAEIDGWWEYVREPEKGLQGQTALGLAFGYRTAEKEGPSGRAAATLTSEAALSTRAGGPGGPQLIPIGVGSDFYTFTEPDTVQAWQLEWGHVGPYLWLPLCERLVLKCSLWYVDRTIEWRDDTNRTTLIENTAVIPGVGLQLHHAGRTYIEAGFVAEYRHRTERRPRAAPARRHLERDFRDHRVYVAYEYRFGEAKILRLIETIDLNREDWGSFWIHDHAFVQAIFEF